MLVLTCVALIFSLGFKRSEIVSAGTPTSSATSLFFFPPSPTSNFLSSSVFLFSERCVHCCFTLSAIFGIRLTQYLPDLLHQRNPPPPKKKKSSVYTDYCSLPKPREVNTSFAMSKGDILHLRYAHHFIFVGCFAIVLIYLLAGW